MTTPTWIPEPPRLPQRHSEGHKGTYGRVLVLAGRRGMSGAAILCGSAAVRGGAGLVQVACPQDAQPVIAAGNPCYTTVAVCQRTDGTYSEACLTELVGLAESVDVLAMGPGLGSREDVGFVVRGLLNAVTTKPIVLDADGLNVLAPMSNDGATRTAPIVMTPHPGEFARLLGMTVPAVQANREELAAEFARKHRCIVLLKGTGTVVTDGARSYRNRTGNPGMATGGTGDVLTGLLAALIGQRLEPFEAACLAAWVHGRAGDLAAAALSQTALAATDVLCYLPAVFRELESE